MVKYANELKEVYVILNTLVEEDYNKIPKITIQAIEKNMNKDYKYEIDEAIELKDNQMLEGTKEILFNIFRDYLATEEQKDKIKKMQAADRRKQELKKQNAHNMNVFENRPKSTEGLDKQQQENVQIIEYRENTFTKIIKFIKNIFRR